MRGLFEGYDRGATTVVLEDADGHITEGPGFNVFAYHDGALWTPARGVLEGVTRRTVLELAQEAGIPVKIAMFDREVLCRADEIFLTSTAGGVMPVTVLDDQPVGDGTPGSITIQLSQCYWAAHDDPRWATPVD